MSRYVGWSYCSVTSALTSAVAKVDRAQCQLGPEIAGDVGGYLHLLHRTQGIVQCEQPIDDAAVHFADAERTQSTEHDIARCAVMPSKGAAMPPAAPRPRPAHT
jgi:hypothetical protein